MSLPKPPRTETPWVPPMDPPSDEERETLTHAALMSLATGGGLRDTRSYYNGLRGLIDRVRRKHAPHSPDELARMRDRAQDAAVNDYWNRERDKRRRGR